MRKWILLLLFLFTSTTLYAAETRVTLFRTKKIKQGKVIGTIRFRDSKHGLLVIPRLHALPRGLHGLHIHAVPDCSNYGRAAKGHFDPKNTGRHLGPYREEGHLGDLPVLFVNDSGYAQITTLAPRLTVKDLRGHAIIVHAQSDNYFDRPLKNGGGGARIACGIIQ